MKIALAQMNPIVGSLDQNTQLILKAAQEAKRQKASLVITPAFMLSGFHPHHLLQRKDFFERLNDQLDRLKKTTPITLLVGHPTQQKDSVLNSASIIKNRKVIRECHETMPIYGSSLRQNFQVAFFEEEGYKIAVLMGQDILDDQLVSQAVGAGADMIVAMDALPFWIDQFDIPPTVIKRHAKKYHIPIIYVNLVGGQDDYVLPGGSFAVNRKGEAIHQAPYFSNSLSILDFTNGDFLQTACPKKPNRLQMIYEALVLSVKDYVAKNNFPGVLIGLSGGIDSALTATIATDAVGQKLIKTVMMQSSYTSDMSLKSAKQMAKNLGVLHTQLDIWLLYLKTLETLKDTLFDDTKSAVYENIQARIRGMLLMALSNETGYLVLATGNESELATGYCTLYGDMVGGFAPLKAIPKTLVYELVHWRNQQNPVILEEIIKRAPSAELKPNQTDQDHLPDYAVLDAIMRLYRQGNQSIEEIVQAGFKEDDVVKVITAFMRNEYKRQQGPIGPAFTKKPVGQNGAYPINHGFL